jgi:hypothetical protein
MVVPIVSMTELNQHVVIVGAILHVNMVLNAQIAKNVKGLDLVGQRNHWLRLTKRRMEHTIKLASFVSC